MGELIAKAREALADTSLPAEQRVHEPRKRFRRSALLRMIRDPSATSSRSRTDGSATRAGAFRHARCGRRHRSTRKAGVPACPETQPDALEAQRKDAPRSALIANVVSSSASRRVAWVRGRRSGTRSTRSPAVCGARTATGAAISRNTKRPSSFTTGASVKDHWYHVQLLRHVWPDTMKPYAEVMSALSHALGDHHDLHVLRGMVSKRSVVAKAIDERQAELQKEAEKIGARVYAEKPDAWLARMRKYWESWRSTAR
jgi:hypothetical protein